MIQVNMSCGADEGDTISVSALNNGTYEVRVTSESMDVADEYTWRAANVAWLAEAIVAQLEDKSRTHAGERPNNTDVTDISAEHGTWLVVEVGLVSVLLTRDESRDVATTLMAMVLEAAYSLPAHRDAST